MTNLSNNILLHYLDNISSLPFDKRYHFASRLFLWSGDTDCLKLLDNFRDEFTYNNNPEKALEELAKVTLENVNHGSKNASALREPYFKKYPQLKLAVVLLFRITFLKNIYGIDCRNLLFEYISKEDLDRLKSELLNDIDAIAILSTHAVNFIYLYEKVFNRNEEVEYKAFFEAAKKYNLNDNIHIQLLIYLFTHCIIGETIFYYREIDPEKKSYYQKMLDILEDLIDENFVNVNLDNKFEFLVCAKILNFKSRNEERIMEEADRSVSDEGTFLIDKHNKNPQTNNIDLASSEHRNVLYIMANKEFSPQVKN